MSVKALLCAAILLFSVLLYPVNFVQSFPDAYGQGLDKAPEKKDKEAKVDSGTLNKRNQALAKNEAASAASSAEDIRVILELDGKASSSDKKELAKLGIKIEGEHETMIQALVPSTQLDVVAELDFIKYISQPLYVVPALTSEGAFVIGANETNAAGFTGQDIRVAIIDMGFDLDNPEIAPNIVEAISFRADGDILTSDPRHGTAVAEIIVDVAPDVQLFLYNVDTGLSLLNALDFIAEQQEVDIVSMSLGIYNAGPYDGTSEISQAVDAVRDSGILFVNSAGNDGQRHWEGNFVDPDSDGLRNFSGDDETIGMNAQAGQFVQVFLSWDDWPVSMQDYDLYVFDDDLSLTTFSENPQILGFPPTEYAEFVATSTGTYHIAISKFTATQDVTFDLFTTVNLNEHNITSSSIAIPSDAAGAFTVGAVFWENGILEPFSSRGPTNDGRIKPDISGPDGVTTSPYSPSPFFGTSAATPYVSGAAALVKDVYPGADADTLQSLLEENTLNNHVKNNDDGTGTVYTSFLLAGIPVANAGADQTVNETSIVMLDGTLSTDSDGTIVSYLWEQVNGTVTVDLTNASSTIASFTSPSVTADVELVFKLTVTDNLGASSSDIVTIIVKKINQEPVADAGSDQTANEGDVVTLNGTGSSDPDGDPITYSWVQTNGTLAELDDPTSPTPTFTAPEVESAGAVLAFELTVSDGVANSTDSVDVIVQNINQAPTANAGSDQVVEEGAIVVLNGTGSFDPDGDTLTFSWIQTVGPAVLLSGADTATPSFTALQVGADGDTLTFELSVNDENEGTDTEFVNVIVQNVNQLPIANSGLDQAVDEGTLVIMEGTASSDPDGDILSYSWVQTAGPAVTLSGADTATPSFSTPLVDSLGATLTFELTVDDGNGGTDTDTVDIIVQNVNEAPLADAGVDQTVDEGDVVTLNGSGSIDPDGDPIIYSWVQTAGPAVILSDTTSATSLFTAPQVDSAGAILTFELTVEDENGGNATDTVDIIVNDVSVNQPPVADAGPDQTIDEQTLVTLNAIASSDPDGTIESYSWTQISGTSVELIDANAATPSFAAPEVDTDGATLTFELTVTDNDDLTSTDTVNVVVQNVNQPPVANAGSDQTVNEGDAVALNGIGSSDPDGDPITYSWTQTAGTIVTLSGADSAAPSFTAPDVDSAGATLTFQLTVDDGNGANATDSVDIIVNNVLVPPIANAGLDQPVNEETLVILDGTASSDSDGDILSYSWLQTNGTLVELDDPTSATPSFLAPEVGADGDILTFELIVTDNDGLTSTDTVVIIVENVNLAPVADAGSDQTVNEGIVVTLNATESSDPDDDSLTFSWVQTAGPEVSLDDPTSATPSFTAPLVDSSGATITFELTVDDDNGANATDTVDILVNDVLNSPVAEAGSDQLVDEGAFVTLDGTGSTDPDGTIQSYSWIQTNGTPVELTGADTATPSFTAPEVDSLGSTLIFELTITDNDGLTNADTVNVVVQNVNEPPVADAGPDQVSDEGALVTLDGTGSTDPDGDILGYSWVQTAGPAVILSDSTSPTPLFTTPQVNSTGAVLTFDLTISDGAAFSTDTVNISIQNVNQAPTANAGPDQIVDESTIVILDGTASSDADGDALAYSWVQTDGTLVVMSDPTSPTPSFSAPDVGADGATLTFQLTVTDNDDLTNTDTMVILVENVNQPPVADSGPDQIVNEGTIVTLDAGSSTDPDGDELAFSWVQTAGPEVSLDDPSFATPSFTAPQVDLAGATLTFELTVSDGDASSTDSVDVTVNDVVVNQAPVADAGSDQTVDEGTVVTLNGTGSSDPDGDTLTFSWTQTNGPIVTLSDVTSPTPSFTAPLLDSLDATLTFELTVDDGKGGTDTDSVDIIVQNINQAPVADAGTAVIVEEGDFITLSGTGSSDPDGDPLTYSWVQTSGTSAELINANTATPSFTAPEVGVDGDILIFELTVSDIDGLTSTDTVSVVVQNVNQAPLANAGLDQTVNEGTFVTLDGTASFDSDGDSITYSWLQIAGPEVSLDDPTSATPSFTAPEVNPTGGVLTFELTVSDGKGGTDTDSVNVIVQNINQPPVADAGSDQVVDEGIIVVLNGSGSSDPDGDALIFSWTQTAGPAVALSGADTATPSFTAPEVDLVTLLTFELTVSDGVANDTDTVDVSVNNVEVNQAPVADAGADQTVDEGTVVTLDGTGSSDSDGDTITFSWTQTNGPIVTLSDVTSPTPSFTAPLVDSLGATLTFELTVDDGKGGTDTDSVDVVVQNVNQAPIAEAGSDQVVDEGTTVVLSATASSDPDGDTLSYSWVQTAGPAVILSDTTSASPSFIAPQVDPIGVTLTFELTVSDGVASSTDSVDVIVQNVNQSPVADAGPDQIVDELTLVNLNGTGSSDPDGDPITYSWTQIAGQIVILSGADSAAPSFTAPDVDSAGATLTFQLTVDDGNASNSTNTVDIIVENVNQLPIADAGLGQTVNEGDAVTLNGTASSDPDGDALTYSWVQTDGTLVRLADSTTPTPSFTAPGVDSVGAVLTFELTVDDGNGANATDSVDIIVNDVSVEQPPVADAGLDETVNEGTVVTLNGTGSSDPDGDTLSYSWVQTNGTSVELDDPASPTPSFTAPEVDSTGATLTFELTVTDNDGLTSTETVNVIVQNVNQLPVANSGPDQTVDEDTVVTLNGIGSSDPDGVIVSYSWEQESGPAVSLNNSSAASTTFLAPPVDTNTILTFRLNVTDNENSSATDAVSITVNNEVVTSAGSGSGGSGRTVIVTNQPSTPPFPATFFALNPLAKIIIQSTLFVDWRGASIAEASEEQQVQINSTLINQQQLPQNYIYIVQITDEDGFTLEIIMQRGTAAAGQEVQVGRSWTTPENGIYTIDIFVWDSLAEAPVPLSDVGHRTITVV